MRKKYSYLYQEPKKGIGQLELTWNPGVCRAVRCVISDEAPGPPTLYDSDLPRTSAYGCLWRNK